VKPTGARVRGVAARLRARHYQGITSAEDTLLVLAYQQGIERQVAIDALLEAHRGLGLAIVRAYARPQMIEDAALEAELGIAAAADRFDPGRQVKFSTFATYHILNRVRRYCVANNWGIRLPEYAAYRAFRIVKILKAQPEATNEHIAELLGLQPENIADSRRIIESEFFSLDDTYQPGGISPIEYLEADQMDTLAAMISGEESASIRAAIDRLRPNHRDYILARFGFDGSEPLTLEEISARRGISRQAVHDALIRAMERLRKELSDEAS